MLEVLIVAAVYVVIAAVAGDTLSPEAADNLLIAAIVGTSIVGLILIMVLS